MGIVAHANWFETFVLNSLYNSINNANSLILSTKIIDDQFWTYRAVFSEKQFLIST